MFNRPRKHFSEVLFEGRVKEDSLVVFWAIGVIPDSETLWLRKSMVEWKNLDFVRLKTSPAVLNRVKTSWTASSCSSTVLQARRGSP